MFLHNHRRRSESKDHSPKNLTIWYFAPIFFSVSLLSALARSACKLSSLRCVWTLRPDSSPGCHISSIVRTSCVAVESRRFVQMGPRHAKSASFSAMIRVRAISHLIQQSRGLPDRRLDLIQPRQPIRRPILHRLRFMLLRKSPCHRRRCFGLGRSLVRLFLAVAVGTIGAWPGVWARSGGPGFVCTVCGHLVACCMMAIERDGGDMMR